MEITNEIKAKVFAWCLGQNVKLMVKMDSMYFGYDEGVYVLAGTILDRLDDLVSCELVLKPLSKITDEECFEIAIMYGWSADNNHKKGLINSGKDIVSQLFYSEFTCYGMFAIRCFQYLQSRGYDLPHYLLGGKTLHECGLAIYE